MVVTYCFFFQAEDGIRAADVTGVQTCALPISVGDRVRVLNTYGPTETTVIATCADLTRADVRYRPPIGRPLPGTRACVLDEARRPVPAGAAGELYLGGAGLALGYLNRPELTAQRFVAHPRWGRLYRTGDRVRRRPDGELEFLGRL